MVNKFKNSHDETSPKQEKKTEEEVPENYGRKCINTLRSTTIISRVSFLFGGYKSAKTRCGFFFNPIKEGWLSEKENPTIWRFDKIGCR